MLGGRLFPSDRQGAHAGHAPGRPLVRARRSRRMPPCPLGAGQDVHRGGARDEERRPLPRPSAARRRPRQRRGPGHAGVRVQLRVHHAQGPGDGLPLVRAGRQAGRAQGQVLGRLHARPRDRRAAVPSGGRDVVLFSGHIRRRGDVPEDRDELRVRPEPDRARCDRGRQVVQVRRGHGPREVRHMLELDNGRPRRRRAGRLRGEAPQAHDVAIPEGGGRQGQRPCLR